MKEFCKLPNVKRKNSLVAVSQAFTVVLPRSNNMGRIEFLPKAGSNLGIEDKNS